MFRYVRYTYPVQQDSLTSLLSSDHILTFRLLLFPVSIAYTVLYSLPLKCVLSMISEHFPFRDSAADCPILLIFKHSRSGLFHPHVVAQKAIRVFQQLSKFILSKVYLNPVDLFICSLRSQHSQPLSLPNVTTGYRTISSPSTLLGQVLYTWSAICLLPYFLSE
ncbi:hypothetical protein [Vibrio phage JSF2]|nr:hypothetical protein [Vibrio phage JSF6]ASV41642.1 hypothetical protein [Vibrio phage JSF1]ASV42010.1 hypothetical protein [Vibrio phage JSF2]